MALEEIQGEVTIMAYFLFVGTTSGHVGDLNTIANYQNSNAGKSALGAASRLPTTGDIIWVLDEGSNQDPTSGTTSATVQLGNGGSAGGGLSGGTYNGPVIDVDGNGSIHAGTFNAPITGNNSDFAGGTFNATVTDLNNPGFFGGTFNAAVITTGAQLFAPPTFKNKFSFDGGSTYMVPAGKGNGDIRPGFN